MITGMVVGFAAMVLCLVVQGFLLIMATRYYFGHLNWVKASSRVKAMLLIAQVMLILVLGNLLQGAIWAVLFMVLGEFGDFSTAYYHSLVNFATLGYGDIVMTDQWRILGPMQAINGVLMIGVSTAAITSVVHDALERSWRLMSQGEGSTEGS
ncbi:MAG: ion channel [Cellvibrionales bacterium]|jgi:hypothetical protein